ncbi:MAG: hypothetical protein ACOZE5_17110 [Verrucomicrobiota bacterium]
MKPEELLDPAKYPEGLKWLAEHFKLPPNDPAFLLLAWHAQKVSGAEDALKLKTMELKAALDARVEKIEAAAGRIAAVGAQLTALEKALEQKPLTLTRRIEADLKTPVAEVIQNLRSLDRSLTESLRNAKDTLGAADRRQSLAALIAGFTAGIFLATFFWLL